jgi:hypothetical protein
MKSLNLVCHARLLLLTVLFCAAAAAQQQHPLPSGPKGDWHNTQWGQSFQPEAGVVPDEKTATAIAEATLLPIYGENTIGPERPLRANLQNGVWTVKDTLPQGFDGATAVVKLARDDGRVLFITHYQ